MALYIGKNKVKINLNSVAYYLNAYMPWMSGMYSSDRYRLRDANGICLLPKAEIEGVMLEAIDGYILHDTNGTYLTIEEDV